MRRFEEELTQAGVDPDDLSPPTSTLDVFTHLLSRVGLFLVLDRAGDVRGAGPLSGVPVGRLSRYQIFARLKTT